MNWISVTDRMPDPDSTVLVFARGIVQVAHVDARPWGPDRIHMIDVPRGSHNDVTHWMPLPANPTN